MSWTFQVGSTFQAGIFSIGDTTMHRFVNRSVLEIFVNADICIVHRVYPLRADSKQVRLFCNEGQLAASNLLKLEMDATNPW